MLQIKLLNNKKGFLITRQPEVVKDELSVQFIGLPAGAAAIFENAENTLYRQLKNDNCSIPKKFLVDEIKITVAKLDGAIDLKWTCEGIKASELKSGEILVCPNDMDIPQKIVDIQLEMQSIKDEMKDLLKKNTELANKMEEMIEGYDLV